MHWKIWLTVTRDGGWLEQQETILALPCWDLSVREFWGELRRFVRLEVLVALREVNLDITVRSSGENLSEITDKNLRISQLNNPNTPRSVLFQSKALTALPTGCWGTVQSVPADIADRERWEMEGVGERETKRRANVKKNVGVLAALNPSCTRPSFFGSL